MTQEIHFSGIKFDLELRPGSLTNRTKSKFLEGHLLPS